MLSATEFKHTLTACVSALREMDIICNLHLLTKMYHVLTTHIDVHAKTYLKVFITAYTKSVEFAEDLSCRLPNDDIVKGMHALREYQRVYNLSPMSGPRM